VFVSLVENCYISYLFCNSFTDIFNKERNKNKLNQHQTINNNKHLSKILNILDTVLHILSTVCDAQRQKFPEQSIEYVTQLENQLFAIRVLSEYFWLESMGPLRRTLLKLLWGGLVTTTTTTQFPITSLNRIDRSISAMFNCSAISSGWRCYLCISCS